MKKGLVTLVCLTMMSAVWSWAATTFLVQIKTTNPGGYVALLGAKADTTAITSNGITTYVGSTKYASKVVDASALASDAEIGIAEIKADATHKIASITKNGVAQGLGDGTIANVTLTKADFVDPTKVSGFKNPTVIATFADKFAGEAKSWQLQVRNNNVGGTISTKRATDAAAAVTTTIGNLVLKNYKDTSLVTVTVAPKDGFHIAKITLNGKEQALAANGATTVVTVDPASSTSKVFTVAATYKQNALVVTNSVALAADGNTVKPATYQTAFGGTVMTMVVPPTTNNLVTAISVVKTGTDVAGKATFTATDSLGNTSAPFRGAVKVVISGIEESVTVKATFETDPKTAIYQQCSATCHTAASATVQAVYGNWDASKHSTKAVDCAACHKPEGVAAADFNMGNLRDLSTIEKKAGLCDSCHNNNSAAFTTSIHWLSETGHESDADFQAAGHGSVASCAAKCHFNQGAQTGCAVCHSGKLAAGGVISAGGDADHKPTVATVDNTCYACHTGSKHGWSPRAFEKSSHYTGYAAVNFYQMNKTKCLACHDSHSTEATILDGKTDSCSKCHAYHGPTAADNYGLYSSNGQGRAPHFGGVKSSLTSNGAQDNPSKGLAAAQTMYMTQGAICQDCHAHNNTINDGYAKSGHGKVSTDPMNAFVHYDWTSRSAADNGSSVNGNCNRCHTTQGFIKFAQQDAATVTRLALKAGQPNNVLLCITCHKALEGEGLENAPLRTDAVPSGNQGKALSAGYFATFSSAATAVTAGNTKITVEFPGYKNSSVCVPCHAGRTTDKVIVAGVDKQTEAKGVDAQGNTIYGNYSTISTSYYQHAANMGQTFIGKGAWEFNTNPKQAIVNSHANVKNGATDTQGPCVGCHYNTAGETHSLEVANFAVCVSCHRAEFGAADVTAAEEKFEAGVKVLTALIKEKFEPLRVNQALPIETERAGIRFGRFGKAAGAPATAATAKSAYGAWYNWHILTNADKAAFVHNPAYARQILFDTIDYLDGNGAALNGSAEATIAASAALTAEEKELAEAYAVPACGSCHATKAAAAQEGKHAAETNTHNGSCGRCHSTEGYLAFSAGIASGSGKLFTGSYTADSYNGATGVSCAVCHDAHNDGVVLRVAPNFAPQVDGKATTAEYKLCTSCHNLTDANSALVGPAMQQHGKDWYRNIASTHYDNPATGTVTNVGTVIEGYVVRANKESACTDCHGHDFYTNTGKALDVPSATDAEKGKQTIHTEWASSGHAGKLLTLKWANYTTSGVNKRQRNTTTYAAIAAIGVTPASGAAWEHYNWDADDRAGCQHCHTATGAANYISGNRTAKNDFSHLQGWTTTGSAQNEVLYCWGCHKDAGTGELLNTGDITLDYKANATDTTNVVLPAVAGGKSTACFSCHAGRGNAASLFKTATIDPTAVLSSTTVPANGATATSTHYANAAATIFKNETKVGYEFPGLNYANPSYFAHNKVGCNDCHMGNKNHKFEVVEKDAAGAITKLVATNCVTCHSGAHGTKLEAGVEAAAAFIEEEAEGYKQALAAFNDALIAQGYTWTSSHPYFTFTGAEAAKKWRKQGDLGAGHNYNYLLHEPGAYAHNRLYTKRLVYDSMDWLDNNIMDGSVAIDAVKYPEAKIWLGTARP